MKLTQYLAVCVHVLEPVWNLLINQDTDIKVVAMVNALATYQCRPDLALGVRT